MNDLTKADIDAMEALLLKCMKAPSGYVYAEHNWGEDKCGCDDCINLNNYRWESHDFICKAIVALREKEDEIVTHVERLLDMSARLEALKEQTRWRHIDREQPKNNQRVLIWGDEEPLQVRNIAANPRWKSDGDESFLKKAYPHWQPLPTKGPNEQT